MTGIDDDEPAALQAIFSHHHVPLSHNKDNPLYCPPGGVEGSAAASARSRVSRKGDITLRTA
jgi:hypothetical protein